MAVNDITLIAGVTKIETDVGFVYAFPLEVITTNTSGGFLDRTPRGESVSTTTYFSNITDKLGATNINEYVDALAIGGYFTSPSGAAPLPSGASTEAKQDDQIAEAQTANNMLASILSNGNEQKDARGTGQMFSDFQIASNTALKAIDTKLEKIVFLLEALNE